MVHFETYLYESMKIQLETRCNQTLCTSSISRLSHAFLLLRHRAYWPRSTPCCRYRLFSRFLFSPVLAYGSLSFSRYCDRSVRVLTRDYGEPSRLDVLPNIFVRLPAKQLAQMRCVSKSWNHLLSQPSFVKSHLDRSMCKNDGILLIFCHSFSFDSKPFTAHSSRSPHLELPNFIKPPLNLKSKHGHGDVIGSVNGLICFKYRSLRNPQAIYIWNPSLSALLTLPPYSIPSHCNDWICEKFRFGFDPKADDYKVVKLIQVDFEWMQVEIYSMRIGSWKLITQNIPSHVTGVYNEENICVAGHVHWLAETSFRYKVDSILSFDLGAEIFCVIPLPTSVTNAIIDDNMPYIMIDLGVLAEKLCVMPSVEDGECEVWVMEEYGVAELWVKQHVFPPCGYRYPYGFTLHNEFLSLVYPDGLGLYDPVASKTNFFELREEYLVTDFKIVEYVDSLVWVTPGKPSEMPSEMSCFINSGTSTRERFLHAFWAILINDCRYWILMVLFMGWLWALVRKRD